MDKAIYSYKNYSNSARLLSEKSGIKRIRHRNSRFNPNRCSLLINWGSSSIPIRYQENVYKTLNLPYIVDTCIDKKKFFNALQYTEVSIPEFTSSRTEAENFIRDGHTILIRYILKGRGGRGIRICNNINDLGDAPLYVVYKKKKREYRVHVFNNEILFTQIKAKRRGANQVNYQIQNLQNGFIYARYLEEEVPECVKDQALMAVEKIGLDFGAVDVIYNRHYNRAYVLEINTAPGLDNSTSQIYADKFLEI